jgi:hypothetical protein
VESNHPLAYLVGAILIGSLLVGSSSRLTPRTCSPHISSMTQAPPPPPCLPYMVSLNFPNLSKLINDPTWLAMPTKLPSDISKFEGQAGEDSTNHVMSFYLWCSLNNIIEDSV